MNIYKHVNNKFIPVNRLRLIIISTIYTIINSLIFDISSLYWYISVCTLIIIFVVTWVWYIPQKYKNLSYSININYILIFSGVVFFKICAIKIDTIQYISSHQTPLERIFKLKSIIVHFSGSKIYIPCLDKKVTEQITNKFLN